MKAKRVRKSVDTGRPDVHVRPAMNPDSPRWTRAEKMELAKTIAVYLAPIVAAAGALLAALVK